MVTAEDRISRGEAPVKAEYIRESEIRVYVPQVHGSNASGTAEQAAVSKRQAKKASCDLEGGGDLTSGSAPSSQRFCWPMGFFLTQRAHQFLSYRLYRIEQRAVTRRLISAQRFAREPANSALTAGRSGK